MQSLNIQQPNNITVIPHNHLLAAHNEAAHVVVEVVLQVVRHHFPQQRPQLLPQPLRQI